MGEAIAAFFVGLILGVAIVCARESVVVVSGTGATGLYIEYKDIVYKLVDPNERKP
jgi:hypothetical protein